jgi:hypothetical protein
MVASAPPAQHPTRNGRQWLALSDERDAWLRFALDLAADAARAAYLDGYRDGSNGAFTRAAAPGPVITEGPGLAELERRRWGPEGRRGAMLPRAGEYAYGPPS